MATTGRIVYHGDDETIKKERREFSLTDEIMELINSGGGGGAINGVKVNGQVVNPDQAGYVGLTIPGVINTLSSNSTSDALSAKQGKVLYEYIQALQHVGHFLALWNTATGLPVTNPETSPYTYNTGDYYIVSNIAAEGGTNYRPNGSSYTINVASTTVESGEVQVNDLYFYDGYERRLLDNSGGGSSIAVDSSLSTTSTNPVQNAVITNRLNQMALDANTKTFWLTNLQDTTTGQDIRDWVDGGGNAIVYYGGTPYYITGKTATRITLHSKFTGTQNSPGNQSTGFTEQLMWIDNNNNTIAISNMAVGLGAPYLATNQNYSTVYTPLYDGSPATKKYVDDKFAAVPTYTAGSNIDITANQISTVRNGYVYVTCNDGAFVKNKTGTSAEGNYTPQEGDLIMIHFVNGCAVGGPTIAIDGGSAIPFYIGVEGANAGNLYFGSNNVSKMFIYTNGRLVGDAVKDNNNTYSAGTGLALSNGTFSNTGVLSVNGQTGAVSLSIPEGSNVKAFFLEDDEDTTTAQAAIDWANEGKLPLLVLGSETYTLVSILTNAEELGLRAVNDFVWEFSCDKDYLRQGTFTPGFFEKSYITISTSRINDVDTVTSIDVSSEVTASVLTTGNSNQTFTPSLNYDPATKKYVDDTVSGAISKGTTAPSSPTEGQLWYDTTNDELKVYDGTTWNVTGGGIKLAANSPLTVTEIWAGTETQYNALATKGATTAYLCVEE